MKGHVPVARSLGCHVKGFAKPRPDPYDINTALDGVKKRVARKPPKPTSAKRRKELLKGLRKFVYEWLKENVDPIPASADVSVETWLQGTNYPAWRREQLLNIWRTGKGRKLNKRDIKCNCFIKRESYPCYKPARGIYSRSDFFKCFSGPFFKLIEKAVYKFPEFIKHVPVRERPEFIKKFLYRVGGKYFVSDYSCYESQFTKKIQNTCEALLYKHMLKNFPGVAKTIIDVLTGVNVLNFKNFTCRVKARRMSGEMCTSLGNGFTNMMVCYYMCNLVGSKAKGVFEGDDGLFRVDGENIPTVQDFADLGFYLKLERVDSLSEASFCGIVADEEELDNVTDIIGAVLDFGWTDSVQMHGGRGKMMQLLKAKSLSLLYEHPCCPILTSLAKTFYKKTEKVKPLWSTNWYETQLRQRDAYDVTKIYKPIGYGTRKLVEKRYLIPIADQIHIEKYFESLVDEPIQVLDDPVLLFHVGRWNATPDSARDASDYYNRYVVSMSPGTKVNCIY
jgi:hypothetical protein